MKQDRVRVFKLTWATKLRGGKRVAPDARGLFRTEDGALADQVAKAMGATELSEEQIAELDRPVPPPPAKLSARKRPKPRCGSCEEESDLFDQRGFCTVCVGDGPRTPAEAAAARAKAAQDDAEQAQAPEVGPGDAEDGSTPEGAQEPEAAPPVEPPTRGELWKMTRAELRVSIAAAANDEIEKPKAKATLLKLRDLALAAYNLVPEVVS